MQGSSQRATLRSGEITLRGQFLGGSNATFLVGCQFKGVDLPAVYKPFRGQAELWDFESETLPKREVAAYLVRQSAGWEFVPLTLIRRKRLPFGPGSLQLYIEHDPADHYFNFADDQRGKLRDIALFDLVCNNADRKGGHLLLDRQGNLWAIDHSLCFHVENKLRTVIWDFAGQAFLPGQLRALVRLKRSLGSDLKLRNQLRSLLDEAEIIALGRRVAELLSGRQYPQPDPQRWVIPWPPL